MLELILAPDPIYKTVCTPVVAVDAAVRATLDAMMQTLRAEHAIGLGAPMVGVTQRLVVIELEDETGVAHSYRMVNPVITERSADMVTNTEASITFVGISAPVTRPAAVTVEYLDEHGAKQTLRATGLMAACVQHEMDYLDGITILDHQSPLKRDMLKRKMEKERRRYVPHVHGEHCSHG